MYPFEAESVAYTVCQHYGIETSDYSFGYIAGWSSGKETAELKASLEMIRSTASDLISQIDGHLLALEKEKIRDREDVAECSESAEAGANARTLEQKTRDPEPLTPKKSVCAELKAPRKKKEPQMKKPTSRNQEEVL
jgi:hypothetical protein